MNELEDIKLNALLHEMKLESPDANFSVRVMDKIFEEESVFNKIKTTRILGNGFWIILVLFVVLFAVLYFVSASGVTPESDIAKILPGLNTSKVSSGYQSIFEKMGTAPLSIAVILLATSVLLFIERFINANSKVFTV
jgi:hypothetical protein